MNIGNVNTTKNNAMEPEKKSLVITRNIAKYIGCGTALYSLLCITKITQTQFGHDVLCLFTYSSLLLIIISGSNKASERLKCFLFIIYSTAILLFFVEETYWFFQ